MNKQLNLHPLGTGQAPAVDLEPAVVPLPDRVDIPLHYHLLDAKATQTPEFLEHLDLIIQF